MERVFLKITSPTKARFKLLTGLAPNVLVAVAPKAAGAAPNAGVCCWVALLPKGVAEGRQRGKKRAGNRKDTGVASGTASGGGREV